MKKLGMFFVIVILLGACGQDRTLDEYYNRRALQEMNKYSKIAGTYTGLAYQKDSKEPLAEVMVTLISSSQVDQRGKRPVSVPVLLSDIRLRSPNFKSELVISTNGGYYIEEENLFQTEVYLNEDEGENTAKSYLSLKGVFRGKSVVADLSVSSDQETSLRLDLSKSSVWPDLPPSRFNEDKYPGPQSGASIEYSGHVKFKGPQKSEATLKITPKSASSKILLTNLLSIEKRVYGRVYIKAGEIPLAFKDMTWNVVNETLNGVAFFGANEVNLDCVATLQKEGWSCDYRSTGGGSAYKIEFSRDFLL